MEITLFNYKKQQHNITQVLALPHPHNTKYHTKPKNKSDYQTQLDVRKYSYTTRASRLPSYINIQHHNTMNHHYTPPQHPSIASAAASDRLLAIKASIRVRLAWELRTSKQNRLMRVLERPWR